MIEQQARFSPPRFILADTTPKTAERPTESSPAEIHSYPQGVQ